MNMKRRKKSKHFKKPLKPIPVEALGLPNNVRIGYKDVKIRYVRQIGRASCRERV